MSGFCIPLSRAYNHVLVTLDKADRDTLKISVIPLRLCPQSCPQRPHDERRSTSVEALMWKWTLCDEFFQGPPTFWIITITPSFPLPWTLTNFFRVPQLFDLLPLLLPFPYPEPSQPDVPTAKAKQMHLNWNPLGFCRTSPSKSL